MEKTGTNSLRLYREVKMRKLSLIYFVVFVFSLTLFSQQSPDQIPKPKFDNIVVTASVEETTLEGSSAFKYSYMVFNPPDNEVPIGMGGIEILLHGGYVFGLFEPEGWSSGTGENRTHSADVPLDTTASFDCDEYGDGTFGANRPLPGTTSGPMGFYSWDRPPMITEVWVTPDIGSYLVAFYDWYENQPDNPETFLYPPKEGDVIASFVKKIPTLCPLGDNISVGEFQHWDRLISDTEKAGQLGWIMDQALLASILQNLKEGRIALQNSNEILAHQKLDAVIALISSASSSQVKREGKDLVYLNAKVLNQYTPWPYEPVLTVTPSSTELSLGEELVLTAKFTDVALNQPIQGAKIVFEVTEGPHYGMECEDITDNNGTVIFNYIGYYEGEDTIVCYVSREELPSVYVKVLWEGGPDLMLSFFVPSSITVEPGGTFYISDKVVNTGTLPAPATYVHYYIGTKEDLSDAKYFGERQIAALKPKESDMVTMRPYILPPELPPQKYYFSCCVDPEDLIAELNEDNNCSDTNIWATAGIVPVQKIPNNPPDCSKATASPNNLWPPNHKLKDISIEGVTEPDGDAVTVTVTSITQDEPVNGLGEGDTSPDGFGVGSANPQVRAERCGSGNGRVYRINFKAVDAKGGECTNFVTVGVPHDKKDTPIDDGQNYDSTLP